VGTKICSKCGTTIPIDSVFCEECGAPVSVKTESDAVAPATTARHVAKRSSIILLAIICVIPLALGYYLFTPSVPAPFALIVVSYTTQTVTYPQASTAFSTTTYLTTSCPYCPYSFVTGTTTQYAISSVTKTSVYTTLSTTSGIKTLTPYASSQRVSLTGLVIVAVAMVAIVPLILLDFRNRGLGSERKPERQKHRTARPLFHRTYARTSQETPRGHIPWDGSSATAEFEGWCPRCHRQIRLGDKITWWKDKNDDFKWIHLECR